MVAAMTAYRFTGPLPPGRFNLTHYCLADATERHPAKPALIIATDAADAAACIRVTYAEMQERVLRLAGGLITHGIQPGERLFIRMGNSLDYALTFLAAIAAGIIPIPASSALSDREVRVMIDDAGATAVAWDPALHLPDLPDGVRVLDPDLRERLATSDPASYADTAADDPAYLIYTSGSSGRPKGVLHAHRAVWGRRPMYEGWYGLGETDTMLHTGAFNWTYTLGTGLCDPWASGATTVVYTGERDVTVWPRLIAAHGATIMASVPTLYRQILKYCDLEPGSLQPLRHGLTAGEALPDALADQWHATTGLHLYEALGMSEISTYISSSPLVGFRRGSPGKAQAGRAVAILPVDGDDTPLPAGESGLLAVHRSDPGMMLRYWNRPEEEAETYRGEWFAGGDMGHFDVDGWFWFEGRHNDLMNAFGYRVSPQEVEQVIARHPGVAEVGVGEVKVRADVSVIAAFVVPRSAGTLSAPDILAFAEPDLAAYKMPREVYFVDHLPRTSNGKLVRSRLGQLI